MPTIKLPDGNSIKFENKVTGLAIAEKISKSLAKQALIINVDGELKDLSYVIEKNSTVKIITHKDSDGLDAMRHDTTHIMAMAVQDLFPGTKLAIGPAIKDGFYYDFSRE
jgi:threonyl-tRNA synthetase